jgi:hypothetical protein
MTAIDARRDAAVAVFTPQPPAALPPTFEDIL